MKDIRERFKKMTPEELEEALRRTAERDDKILMQGLADTIVDNDEVTKIVTAVRLIVE